MSAFRLWGGELVRLRVDRDGVSAGCCGVVWGIYDTAPVSFEATFIDQNGHETDATFEEHHVDLLPAGARPPFPERMEAVRRVLESSSGRGGDRSMRNEDVHRIQFESTLDEVVDANIRLTTRTRSFRAYRTRAVWIAGASLGGTLLGVVFLRSRRGDVALSVSLWSTLVVLAVVLGACFGYAYGRYINSAMRRQYRRVVAEQFGGITSIQCVVELRRNGVWALQKGIEMTFPWSNSVGIDDTGEEIELLFSPGLVGVPNRAFRDDVQRTRFLERARALARESKTAS